MIFTTEGAKVCTELTEMAILKIIATVILQSKNQANH